MNLNEIEMSKDSEFIPITTFLRRLIKAGGKDIRVQRTQVQFSIREYLINAYISKDNLIDSRILKRYLPNE